MSISLDSSTPSETIVLTTRSSLYELVVLRPDRGELLVRGGSYFSAFSPVLFLGSINDDGSVDLDRFAIGRRLKFAVGDQVIVTSPVQSLSFARQDARSTR